MKVISNHRSWASVTSYGWGFITTADRLNTHTRAHTPVCSSSKSLFL